ncbi:MAG: hypothetical protein AAFV29_12585, partial [Myxococcota bacterium]
RIVIHLDTQTPPMAFQSFFPRLVPIYNHLQTALVLHLDGTIPAEGVVVVAKELVETFGFDRQSLVQLAEDIFLRRRPYIAQARLEGLVEELKDTKATRDLEDDAPSETTRAAISDIATCAEQLLNRPKPGSSTDLVPRTDYEALWQEDTARQAEARRARRMAAKANRSKDIQQPPADAER